ncbi:leucine-rich repeat protein [uncultured Draconibacterium sp.]|uniref:leucine-rich repeat protein n=1 Tax=uncultured Draconibacterium sp. TaxID=1573823 RepID=UPI003261BC88
MKKALPLLLIFVLVLVNNLNAAFLRNVPIKITQPGGAVINCFASGDEFFNWMHDADNYTIIKNGSTGYYTYAVIVDGKLVASPHIVGTVNPATLGIEPGLLVRPEREQLKSAAIDDISYAPSTGDYNNIVVFIRFADQAEFTEELSSYDDMFNGAQPSLHGYFSEVSGGQLNVVSTMYPTPSGNTIVSYQDAQVRDYYVPYDSLTNPIGYINDRTEREHTLLENALNEVIPTLESSGINFDSDADGYVDNVCFIVQGATEGWSELLWPHKWSLYSKTVYISGARVWEFNFQLSDVTDVSVLCHEMFHTLGAPDLYHYNDESSNLYPVAGWDLMANDNAQHMLTWMKYQYGNWFSEIPEITASGTYKLPAVADNPFACYKIPVPESSTEFFMVEYRKKQGYDSYLYGSYDEGLLVYRVNTSVTTGNRNGPPDELYVLRPGVTESLLNGYVGDAALSADQSRTLVNDSSDPLPLLSDGSATSLSIYDVGFIGDSIEFKVGTSDTVLLGYTLTCDDVTIVNGEITASADSLPDTDIIIPETLCGQTVTRIGDNAFKAKELTSVQFPSTIESIGFMAFDNNSLQTVDLSHCANLTFIDQVAFASNSLIDVSVPESTYIGHIAFRGYNNRIATFNGQPFDGFFYGYAGGNLDYTFLDCYAGVDRNVVIPQGVKTISYTAMYASGLYSVTLSNTVTYISQHAFTYNHFSSFILPVAVGETDQVFSHWVDGNGNTYAGGESTSTFDTDYTAVFVDAHTLTCDDVTIVDGTITNCTYDYADTDILIPDSLCGQLVTGLGYGLFRFKGITSVQLPAGLESIGESAFEHNNLSQIDFSRCQNLSYIGPLAFMGNNLSSLELPYNIVLGGGVFNGNHISTLNREPFDGFFYEFNGEMYDYSVLISYAHDTATVQIPAWVERLGDHALNTCGLTNVDFSLCTGLTEIGYRAFFGNQIPSVDLSPCGLLETIGNSAFLYSGLNGIDLSMCTSLTFIGGAAFESNNFESFILPTPQIEGLQFLNWTDGFQNTRNGGDTTLNLDIWYQANFSADSLLPLEVDVFTNDALCYGDFGFLTLEISGGLGGSYGLGGFNPEAENDSNAYVVYLSLIGGGSVPMVLEDDQNNATIQLEAGSYSILVEDAAGNEVESFAVVMQPDPLELIIDQYSFMCPGDTAMNLALITIGGIDPYQYSIYKNGELYTDYTTETNHWLYGEGVYEFLAEDANGCIVVDTFILETSPMPDFSVIDVSCFSDQKASALIEVDGEPGDSYQATYTYHYNDTILYQGTSDLFESELVIGDLEFDDDPQADIFYVFSLSNSDGCLLGETSLAFEPPAEPLTFSYTEIDVRELDADIELNVQGGVAPYQIWIDGTLVQSWNQTLSTGYHSVQVVDGHLCVTDDIIYIEPFIACPQHFDLVWDGNPNEAMNIYIVDAKIDGVDLEPGDQIGIFDGELCVGYGKLEYTIEGQNILSIITSSDDGTASGFTPGNEITYKIWRCIDAKEFSGVYAQCYTSEAIATSCSPFIQGGTAYVALLANSEVNFVTDFYPGWNIFSSPVVPDSSDLEFVFSDLINTGMLIKMQDETGASLEDHGTFGGWINAIGNLHPAEGYKVKVAEYDSLYLSGQLVNYPYGIVLSSGWNIIGFPSMNIVDGMDIVQQLIDNGSLLKVQDQQGNSIEDLGMFGGWQNFIGNFWAGRGFKVKVSAPDTLWIYENYPKSGTTSKAPVKPQHFSVVYNGNGVDHMNFNFVNLGTEIMAAGDELAVFDGEDCVGAVTLLPEHLEKQVVALSASSSDGSGMTGFNEGNTYNFRLWQAGVQHEINIEPELVAGEPVFIKHESALLSMNLLEMGANELAEMVAVNCYPNPFNDAVALSIDLASDSKVEVLVMNQMGQCIHRLCEEQQMSRGNHKLQWTGTADGGGSVSSGIYYLRIHINDKMYNKKIVYNK